MLLLRQYLMECRLYSRDRVALFWNFAFPMLMLMGFGTIFRSGLDAGGDRGGHLRRRGLPGGAGPAGGPGARPGEGAASWTPQEADARWQQGETTAQLEPDGAGLALKVNTYLAAQGQMPRPCRAGGQPGGADPPGRPRAPARAGAMESPGHAHSGNYAAFLLPGCWGSTS